MFSRAKHLAQRRLRPLLPEGVIRRVRAARQTASFLSDPRRAVSMHPPGPRKGRLRVALDHALWVLWKGEIYDGYFLVGQDVRGAGVPANDHSYRYRMGSVTRAIQERGDEDLADLMKDKSRFAAIAEELGYPSPKNLALLTPTGIERPPGTEEAPYSTLSEWSGLRGFGKPIRGQFGGGTFTLDVDEGRIRLNGEPATPSEVQDRVQERVLLQERIEQREELSALYPGCINTVRLITAHKDGRVFPFHAALRLGANGSVVDNWSAGGLIIDLDLETGRLVERGFYKPGLQPPGAAIAATRHPDTGVVFEGYQIPDFAVARDLVCRFHRDLDGLLTIGWDVAFTPAGPVIIEGNTHWDGRIYMASDPTFGERYRALFSSP